MKSAVPPKARAIDNAKLTAPLLGSKSKPKPHLEKSKTAITPNARVNPTSLYSFFTICYPPLFGIVLADKNLSTISPFYKLAPYMLT